MAFESAGVISIEMGFLPNCISCSSSPFPLCFVIVLAGWVAGTVNVLHHRGTCQRSIRIAAWETAWKYDAFLQDGEIRMCAPS